MGIEAVFIDVDRRAGVAIHRAVFEVDGGVSTEAAQGSVGGVVEVDLKDGVGGRAVEGVPGEDVDVVLSAPADFIPAVGIAGVLGFGFSIVVSAIPTIIGTTDAGADAADFVISGEEGGDALGGAGGVGLDDGDIDDV